MPEANQQTFFYLKQLMMFCTGINGPFIQVLLNACATKTVFSVKWGANGMAGMVLKETTFQTNDGTESGQSFMCVCLCTFAEI